MSNPCVSRLPLIFASSLFAVTLIAQRGTDFSGSWALDETQVRPAPDIPQRLVVRQPVTTTNARGAPMPPAYLTLNVTLVISVETREKDEAVATRTLVYRSEKQ